MSCDEKSPKSLYLLSLITAPHPCVGNVQSPSSPEPKSTLGFPLGGGEGGLKGHFLIDTDFPSQAKKVLELEGGDKNL